ncbi:hypothetical protein SteCoe_35338 [Stentor coeruleus]|uniref:Uncharacterized protein n=1 Tax=Stentor coeruleus TaxID=5963 RepID=A0A1R2ASL5_9CILI|nr:hypothetical protein SteCoe_35338 [Stentor coeruleus]
MSTRNSLLKESFLAALPKLTITKDPNDDFTAASSLRSHANEELPNLNESRNKSIIRRPIYTFKESANYIARYQNAHKKTLSNSINIEYTDRIEKIEEEKGFSQLESNFIQKYQNKYDKLLQDHIKLKAKCADYEKCIEMLQQENQEMLKFKKELETLKNEKANVAKAITLKRSKKSNKLDAHLIELFSKETSKEYISEKEIEELEVLLNEEKKKSEQFSELFTQEHKKNIILHDQVNILNGVISLLKVCEKGGDSTESIIKLLKDKNEEYYSQLVSYSDQVYEKTLENRQFLYQNETIAKDLRDCKEKLKELPELRSHITTLLQLIRKLRQEINNAAKSHLLRITTNNINRNEDHEEFISKITTIADQAKEDLVAILKNNLGKMMNMTSIGSE